MVNPAIQKLFEEYTSQCDGQSGYRRFVAITRIHMALKELAADEGIDWEDIEEKAKTLPGWRSEQEKLDCPPKS